MRNAEWPPIRRALHVPRQTPSVGATRFDLTARRDRALDDDWGMSASDDGLHDRIDAAERFRLLACQDYNTKLEALATTGAEAQEIERLRTVCDDAKVRLGRVRAGGEFVESVDEALAVLPPGTSVIVAPNTDPWTVSAVQPVPGTDRAILATFNQFPESIAVTLRDIVSVEYLALH
jgi:hypothetical protein